MINNAVINPIPIIAIDGPTACGKGTIARMLAKHFGYHYLNVGSLYRLTAYLAKQKNIDAKNIVEIVKIGESLRGASAPLFIDEQVVIGGMDVWGEISKEEIGKLASLISPIRELRQALYDFERSQIKLPGLVAEGRDMTSEVFKDAHIKIYLDASPEEQAKRRWKDEQSKNSGITFERLVQIMEERNNSDKNREHGKLEIVPEAYYIDTSNLDVEGVFKLALDYAKTRLS